MVGNSVPGRLQEQVIVVGAGIAGLCTALRLSLIHI